MSHSKTPMDGAGSLWTFYGCHIELADPINGFYIQQPEYINDRPCFMRQTTSPDSDPMMIWYMPKMNLWMVNNRTQVGTENAKAVVKQDVQHPSLLTKTWHVFFPSEEEFIQIPNQKFRAVSEAEEKETRQRRIKVSGRLGYNRAMNGIYNRGDKLHAGKSYYKHETNEFTLRWYQTKWVVDWRAGLHNDNVGAAVCKEDVPEPWMCTIPWRIYDGKAKGKKWNYDRDVTIQPECIFENKGDHGTFE